MTSICKLIAVYLIAVWELDRLFIKNVSKPILKEVREVTNLRDPGPGR
jgi:hypothetical protein